VRLAITAPHTNPVTRDFATTERAACAFPAPSLFATRTLKTQPPDSLTQTLSFGTREACSIFSEIITPRNQIFKANYLLATPRERESMFDGVSSATLQNYSHMTSIPSYRSRRFKYHMSTNPVQYHLHCHKHRTNLSEIEQRVMSQLTR
jgi:AraC-like DNA-binding protein